MIYKAPCVAFGMLSGLLLCFYASFHQKLILLAVIAVLILLSLKMLSGMIKKCTFVILVFALISVVYNIVFTAVNIDSLTSMTGEAVPISGIVTDCKDSDSSSVTVKGDIGGVHGKINIYIRDSSISPGDTVSMTATVKQIENTALFNARDYYYSNGVFVTASSPSDITVTKASGLNAVYGFIRSFRDRITTKLCQYAGLEEGRFLSGMLAGRSSELPSDISLAANRSGIGHILVVSGIHVAILSMFIEKLMRILGVHRFITFALAEGTMVLFCIFSGMRSSAVRALIMMSIYYISKLIMREYDSLAALSTCVIIMLAVNPYIAANSSFLLSIAGVLGVGTAAPAVIAEFNVKSRLAKSVITAMSASVCSLPVCLFMFDEISIVSAITNTIVVPFCTAALCLCMIFAIFGGPDILSFLVKLAGLTISGVMQICRRISSLSFTYMPIKFSFIAPIVFTLFIIAVLMLLMTKNTRKFILTCLGIWCSTAVMVFAAYAVDTDKTHIRILTYDSGYLCVVSQNSDCIVIDSEGSRHKDFEKIIREEGMSNTSAVILLDNGTAEYTGYMNTSVKPDKMIFSDADNAYGVDSELLTLTDGTTIDAFGVEITYCGDKCISIKTADDLLMISSEALPTAEAENYIVTVGGLTVIRCDDKVILSKNGLDISVNSSDIGEIVNGVM